MGPVRQWRWVLLRCVVGGGCAGASAGVLWAGVLSVDSAVALRSRPEAAPPGLDLLLVSVFWAGSVGAVLGAATGALLGVSTAGVGERWNSRWLSPGLLLAVLPPLAFVALVLVGLARSLPLDGAAGPVLLAWGFALVGVLVVHHRTWWLNHS